MLASVFMFTPGSQQAASPGTPWHPLAGGLLVAKAFLSATQSPTPHTQQQEVTPCWWVTLAMRLFQKNNLVIKSETLLPDAPPILKPEGQDASPLLSGTPSGREESTRRAAGLALHAPFCPNVG